MAYNSCGCRLRPCSCLFCTKEWQLSTMRWSNIAKQRIFLWVPCPVTFRLLGFQPRFGPIIWCYNIWFDGRLMRQWSLLTTWSERRTGWISLWQGYWQFWIHGFPSKTMLWLSWMPRKMLPREWCGDRWERLAWWQPPLSSCSTTSLPRWVAAEAPR